MDDAIEAIVKACAHIVIDHYTFMCKVGNIGRTANDTLNGYRRLCRKR